MSPLLKRTVSLIEARGATTLAATLAGFLGKWSWLFDLCAHFRLQYFAVLLFASGVAALARRRWLAVSFGIGALINLATLVPFYSSLGRGIEPTWPASIPFMRIPSTIVSMILASPSSTAKSVPISAPITTQ